MDDIPSISLAPLPTTDVPPMVLFLRFLYLNNDRCAYTKRNDVNPSNIQQRLQCILSMGLARHDLPTTIIIKVSFVLPRKVFYSIGLGWARYFSSKFVGRYFSFKILKKNLRNIVKLSSID